MNSLICLNVDNFKLYAKYYNLIYKDKDYGGEAKYCIDFIREFSPEAKTILNLGCGTGMHDFIFARNNFSVLGVDISPGMIALANENKKKLGKQVSKRVDFAESDVRTFKADKQFDVVTSLFHVMSYQTSNNDVAGILTTAYKHLKPGGIFIFDFWYGPAVLHEKPEVRVREFSGDNINVTRIAIPEIHHEQNSVDVNYKLFIGEDGRKKVTEIEELHRMRYFFYPEFLLWFEKYNFKILRFCEWLTDKKPSLNSWSAVYVLKKR